MSRSGKSGGGAVLHGWTDVVGGGAFGPTQWTLISTARDPGDPQCTAALESLCRAYWYPLYAYVRHRGYSADEAQDLTQAFFYRLLSHDHLRAADREKGRFRTFLLLAMKRFLANEWQRAGRQKRGGGCVHIPIDQGWAEETYHHEPAENITPETLYERHWAMLLLGRAMDSVEREMASSDRAELFEDLKDCLTGSRPARTYSEIGRDAGMSVSAVKASAHRMRLRLRSHVRRAICETVRTPEEVEDELRHLFDVFS
jgi:RNA polymerase sigma-70 factor (ECF subfamily)